MKIKLLGNIQHTHIIRKKQRIHLICDSGNSYPNTEKVVYVNIINIFTLENQWVFPKKNLLYLVYCEKKKI